jgi:hypothetical protein
MKKSTRASHRLQKRLAMLALFLSLAVMLGGCQSESVEPPEASPIRSMKGYELYSWQIQGDWYFALVVGTNRIKTYDEISSQVRVQALEALERELDQLPSGEQVFWSAGRVPNTTLPPDEMVDEIRAYCRQRGIQLEIEQEDPNIVPPPGYYEPVRGSGKVWRDVQGVRDRLGFDHLVGGESVEAGPTQGVKSNVRHSDRTTEVDRFDCRTTAFIPC